MLSTESLSRITWRCIHFVDPQEAETVVSQLAGSTVLVVHLDVRRISSEGDFLLKLRAAFQFPDFRPNWNAVDECLSDLDWLPAKGYVLVVHDASELWRQLPRVAGLFVDVWLDAAESWGQRGVPFHLVLAW